MSPATLVTVARGRTVVVDGTTYRPNQQFRASRADVEYLLQSGFLADPDGSLAMQFGKPPPTPKPGLVRGAEREPVTVPLVEGGQRVRGYGWRYQDGADT